MAAQDHPVARVAVLNDYDVVVAGVSTMLSPYADRVQVVHVVSGQTPVEDVDVVLLDTFGRAVSWTRVSDVLQSSRAKVLLYSWEPAAHHTAGFVSLGATGFISKRASAEQLVAAIEAVARGAPPWAGPRAGDQGDLGDRGGWRGAPARLTAREAEVVTLIVGGLHNEEIAERLYLGVNTVKTYIRTAYRKMGVSTRAQAVLWGVENGFYIPALAVRSPSHSGRRSRNPRVDTTRASDLARHVP